MSESGFDNDSNVIVVNLICGPRSLSTATMYSFAQRADTTGIKLVFKLDTTLDTTTVVSNQNKCNR